MKAIRKFRKDSSLGPGEVLEEAIRYFGPGGLGLQITEHTAAAVNFVGGGGDIDVEIESTAPDEHTSVEVRTAEWCYHARRFLDQI